MGENPKPLVSIVTPVYNGEGYLHQCLDSVLAQTYQSWEHIIVNNCSTDRTLEIAASYAERDPRIRVHTNDELMNLLRNHNRAVALMTPVSKYCKVLHADDWLFPNCLELMVEVAEASPRVGLVGSYGLTGNRVVGDGLPYETTVVPGRELARLALLGRVYPFWSPTSLLMRSDLVRQRSPFYDEERSQADHMACYEMLRSSDYGFVHQVLTYIRRHDDSLTSTVSLPLDTFQISNLDLLLRYGPEFLTRQELQERLDVRFSWYYQLMVRRFIQRRDREYWMYHRRALKTLGYEFDRWRVFAGVVREFLSHPRSVLRTMYASNRAVATLAQSRSPARDAGNG